MWRSKIIRSNPEASEVTRQCRTLNISKFLSRGVERWNKWKTERDKINTDKSTGEPRSWTAELSGANLEGADLSRKNLAYVDLGEANLRGATFSETFLLGANLSGADL